MSSLLLPCHPQRRNDEILSSWLLKIASDNVVPVKRLLKKIDISGRNLDSIGSDDPRLAPIANALGLSKTAIVPALPSSLHGLFGNGLFPPKERCWLLRCNRGAPEVKSQYCPMCIREYGYCQVSWTITLHTCCLWHRCFLLKDCSHCGKPFRNAFRSYDSYISDPAQYLQRCRFCAESLDGAKVELTDEETILKLTRILSSLSRKPTCYGYFTVVHELIHLICGQSALAKYMRPRMRLDPNKIGSRSGMNDPLIFNQLGANLRASIVLIAICLFIDWPFYFIDVLKSINQISRPFKCKFLPAWYRHVSAIASTKGGVSLRAGYREEFLDIASREGWITAVQFADSIRNTYVPP